MIVGDIVTHVDGKEVATGEELRIAVSSHPPGTEVPIKVWRRGKVRTLKMLLAEDPREAGRFIVPPRVDSPFEPGEENPATAAGLGRFETFTPGLAARQGVAFTPGVLVRLIERGSAAMLLDIEPACIITEVDGWPVHDLQTFADALDKVQGDAFTVTVKQWQARLGKTGYETKEVQLPTQ